MYKLSFCGQKESWKYIFQRIGGLSFKTFYFGTHHVGTSWRQWTKQIVKKLNFWGKTAADKSAWVKACTDMIKMELRLLAVLICHNVKTACINPTIFFSRSTAKNNI